MLRADGRAVLIGPVRPANPLLRRLAEAWMLFPTQHEYRDWFSRSGIRRRRALRRSRRRGTAARAAPYAVAVERPQAAAAARRRSRCPPPDEAHAAPAGPVARVRAALRFAGGSLAGALFVPLAAVLALRHRLQERRAR